MFVGSEFPGDDNHVLMDVQHAVYGEMVGRLFAGPRDRYLTAGRLLRVDDEFVQKLRSMTSFDHRTLQGAHDRIAAYFRFRRDDGGQLQLGETDPEYRQRLEHEWRAFFQKEIEYLTADDEFTRAVCTATAHGNKDPGCTAESWLDQFLRDRYSERGLVFAPVTRASTPG